MCRDATEWSVYKVLRFSMVSFAVAAGLAWTSSPSSQPEFHPHNQKKTRKEEKPLAMRIGEKRRGCRHEFPG
jgi:hypothetical protein